MKISLFVIVASLSLAAASMTLQKPPVIPSVSRQSDGAVKEVAISHASTSSLTAVPQIGIPPARRVDGCAGEWTRAVATINDPEHNNTMVIRRAASSQDAVRRARQCRSDVGTVTYFDEGARLACAPYIACDTN